MGLAAIARAAASIGFAAAGDTKVSVTVKTGPTPVHDTTTDLSTVTWTHTTEGVQGFLYDAEEKEGKDAKTSKVRKKTLLLQGADLPAPPTEESVIIIGADQWEVSNVETDPAAATHNLSLRR